MKHLFPILLTLVLFSCGNERSLILPEIENATITELHDVSHAYLFYDETKEDSVDLNRKNLISTTNWLINVDKRLTLEQAIPKIKQLQDKKRNAKMHKNDAAKNYYTCNDTSIKNLGFLEFTDVVYHSDSLEHIHNFIVSKEPTLQFDFYAKNRLKLFDLNAGNTLPLNEFSLNETTIQNVLSSTDKGYGKLILSFKSNLLIQDYITFKKWVQELESDIIVVDNDEFIY